MSGRRVLALEAKVEAADQEITAVLERIDQQVARGNEVATGLMAKVIRLVSRMKNSHAGLQLWKRFFNEVSGGKLSDILPARGAAASVQSPGAASPATAPQPATPAASKATPAATPGSDVIETPKFKTVVPHTPHTARTARLQQRFAGVAGGGDDDDDGLPSLGLISPPAVTQMLAPSTARRTLTRARRPADASRPLDDDDDEELEFLSDQEEDEEEAGGGGLFGVHDGDREEWSSPAMPALSKQSMLVVQRHRQSAAPSGSPDRSDSPDSPDRAMSALELASPPALSGLPAAPAAGRSTRVRNAGEAEEELFASPPAPLLRSRRPPSSALHPSTPVSNALVDPTSPEARAAAVRSLRKAGLVRRRDGGGGGTEAEEADGVDALLADLGASALGASVLGASVLGASAAAPRSPEQQQEGGKRFSLGLFPPMFRAGEKAAEVAAVWGELAGGGRRSIADLCEALPGMGEAKLRLLLDMMTARALAVPAVVGKVMYWAAAAE